MSMIIKITEKPECHSPGFIMPEIRGGGSFLCHVEGTDYA